MKKRKNKNKKALLYLHSKINDFKVVRTYTLSVDHAVNFLKANEDVEVVYITEEEETPEVIEKFLLANKTIAVIHSIKVLRTISINNTHLKVIK